MTGTSPDSVAVFSYEEIIGDGLYKLPFVRALRAAWPSARITWITTKRTVYAGKLQPVMDGLIDEFRQDSGIGEARPASSCRCRGASASPSSSTPRRRSGGP